MNLFGAFWTIAGGVAWAVVFGIMAKPKHDANFIFTEFINNSGYTSKVWVFVMSFYSPMYGLYGTDGMMHLVCLCVSLREDCPFSGDDTTIVPGLC